MGVPTYNICKTSQLLQSVPWDFVHAWSHANIWWQLSKFSHVAGKDKFEEYFPPLSLKLSQGEKYRLSYQRANCEKFYHSIGSYITLHENSKEQQSKSPEDIVGGIINFMWTRNILSRYFTRKERNCVCKETKGFFPLKRLNYSAYLQYINIYCSEEPQNLSGITSILYTKLDLFQAQNPQRELILDLSCIVIALLLQTFNK